jgi:hypothetical protein
VKPKYFIVEMTTEDLAGGDDGYVHWAGECKLMQKLEKLCQLGEISYGG